MNTARFRFYGPLNDFLPRTQRQEPVVHRFLGRPAVADAVEALGVPRAEVHLVVANGAPVRFGYGVADGDAVSVFPRFVQLPLPPGQSLQAPHPDPPRFVLDAHLGRLAKYLRMLGLDTRFANDPGDAGLAAISAEEDRILLTRDRGLLRRRAVRHGHYVRAADPHEQLHEILRRFDLEPHFAPLSRCLRCNTPLERVDKATVVDRVPPDTARHFDAFFHCEGCDRVYWKGSHFEAMQRTIASLRR